MHWFSFWAGVGSTLATLVVAGLCLTITLRRISELEDAAHAQLGQRGAPPSS
jgi:hypothetical protein